MADEPKPEEAKTKEEGRKFLPGMPKVPLDAILLVVAPFVTFVLLFLYLMGFLPPQPVIIHVMDSGTTQTSEAAPDAITAAESGSAASEANVSDRAAEAVEEAASAGEATSSEAVATEAVSTQGVEQKLASAAEEETPVPQSSPREPSDRTTPSGDDGATNAKQIAKVYEQMNAASVAAIVANLSDDEAVDILSNMKARNAAKILASLDPQRAAALSLLLTR
jgi:flagellar motility protein MotE (MotC chaperone)